MKSRNTKIVSARLIRGAAFAAAWAAIVPRPAAAQTARPVTRNPIEIASGRNLPAIDLSILRRLRVNREFFDRGWDPIGTLIEQRTVIVDPAAHLESELLRQLKAGLPGGADGMVIGKPRYAAALKWPESAWTVDFQFRMPLRGVGSVPFTGTIHEADGKLRRLTGAIDIDRVARGVQVRGVVRRGEILRAEDMVELAVHLSDLPNDTFASTESLAGSIARAELRPGVWLTGRMVARPSAVKNRQKVFMRLVRGPLTISGSGTARQDGAIGDLIRVMNDETGREIVGRVVSADTVEIVY